MTMTYWRAKYRTKEGQDYLGDITWSKELPQALSGQLLRVWSATPEVMKIEWHNFEVAILNGRAHTVEETAECILKLRKQIRRQAARRGAVLVEETWTEVGKAYAPESEAA